MGKGKEGWGRGGKCASGLISIGLVLLQVLLVPSFIVLAKRPRHYLLFAFLKLQLNFTILSGKPAFELLHMKSFFYRIVHLLHKSTRSV